MQVQDTATAGQAKRRVAGLALGLGAFLAILAAPDFGSGPAVKSVAAVTVLMAILWMTEAAPWWSPP